MKTTDFFYDLPKELIAQKPSDKRDNSKLMVITKNTEIISNQAFSDVLNYLKKGDVLVFNDSKVLKARLTGKKAITNANIEILLLDEENDIWNCLVKPAKRVSVGTVIDFGETLKGVCVTQKEEGIRGIKFSYSGSFFEIIDKIGSMPLPPYIKERNFEEARYQTIYAKNSGSVAAPTAGLHFTEDILRQIKEKGVETVFLTLHVGLGTFKPVEVLEVEKHQMHLERYGISKETAEKLNAAKKEGRRIIAVGTTSVRTLESNYQNGFKEETGKTGIFIYPGYAFKTIDGLITNFHLPKSTLLMLVSAFAGKELIFKAYDEAIKNEYRFFSFGDAMLII